MCWVLYRFICMHIFVQLYYWRTMIHITCLNPEIAPVGRCSPDRHSFETICTSILQKSPIEIWLFCTSVLQKSPIEIWLFCKSYSAI